MARYQSIPCIAAFTAQSVRVCCGMHRLRVRWRRFCRSFHGARYHSSTPTAPGNSTPRLMLRHDAPATAPKSMHITPLAGSPTAPYKRRTGTGSFIESYLLILGTSISA